MACCAGAALLFELEVFGQVRRESRYSPGRGGIALKFPGFAAIASRTSGCSWKKALSWGCLFRNPESFISDGLKASARAIDGFAVANSSHVVRPVILMSPVLAAINVMVVLPFVTEPKTPPPADPCDGAGAIWANPVPAKPPHNTIAAKTEDERLIRASRITETDSLPLTQSALQSPIFIMRTSVEPLSQGGA